MTGLSDCQDLSATPCVTKLLECIFSGIILIAAIYQIVKTFITQGKYFSSSIIFIQIFISTSLIFNILHDIWGTMNYFFYMEILFNQMFFLTVIYFVAYNTYQKQIYRRIMIMVYIIFLMFYVGITIQRSVENPGTTYFCEEKWFLVIDSCAIVLSIFLFVSYRFKQNRERSISQQYFRRTLNSQHIKSPFKRMWLLIGTNIFCSVVGFSRTIALICIGTSSCSFSNNPNTEAILNLFFAIISYYLGMCAALVIFWLRRRSLSSFLSLETIKNTASSQSSPANNKIQLIDRQSIDSHKISSTSS